MSSVSYPQGNDLDLDEVIQRYRASTLGERRPVEQRAIMQRMIARADLIITAWNGKQLIGISRTLTDFAYVTYLADLAVHHDYQHQGIGTSLVTETRNALEPTCFLTLLSAPGANDFYPRTGFVHHPRAWIMEPRLDPNSPDYNARNRVAWKGKEQSAAHCLHA